MTGHRANLIRVAAFLYIAFYAVTDHIAGIGTGVVMQQSGASSTSERPEIGWLFGVRGLWRWRRSRPPVVAVRDGGRRVLPGGLLLVISSGYFAIGSGLSDAVPQLRPTATSFPSPTPRKPIRRPR
jgi:hypothetical protein